MDLSPKPDGPLDQLMSVHEAGPGAFTLAVPDGWQQGRGAFGGYVVGAMIRALEASSPDKERTLRSVTAELCGPLQPGRADIHVEPLRTGTGMTTAACRTVQAGEVQAHAVGVLGKVRTRDCDGVHHQAPQMPAWRELEVIPVEPPLGPAFARFFEFRSAGPFPFSGDPVPRAQGWIRPKNPGVARDAAFVAACIDAWWPAVLATQSVPRPMATVAFTLQLTADLDGLDPDAPLWFQSKDLAIRDGYIAEHRELWAEDGRLVALNQQTFVIIR